MKSILAALLLLAVPTFSHCQTQARPRHRRLTSIRQFDRYIGTYPCENGLLEQPVLVSSLRDILGSDFEAYKRHVEVSGCGAIEKIEGYLLLDVSQSHIGGYTSFILINADTGAVHLFWLKASVSERQYDFYGQRPIPPRVGHIVERKLNQVWGHVAQFAVDGDKVAIGLKE